MTPERRTPGGNRANAKQSAETAPPEYSATPSCRTSPRRRPPYALAMLNMVRTGKSPNVYLFAGAEGWNQAEHRRRTFGEGTALVLPPSEDPEGFRWPALDALCLIPGDCDGDRLRRLVVAMLAAGCRCIVEVRPGQAPACHYASAEDARRAA